MYTHREPLIDTRMHTHTHTIIILLSEFLLYFRSHHMYLDECEMIIWTISLLCIDYSVLLAPILGLTIPILFLDVGDFL